MWYVILSIICSVTVGIILKLAKRNQLSIFQIITWNYGAAIIATYLIFKPNFQVDIFLVPIELFISLSLLLPIVFLFQNTSIKYNGIVKTDIAQRLSLFIPIIASYFLFKEVFTTYKIVGLVLGFLAIFFMLFKKSEIKNAPSKWIYPLFVLFGFGIIDILFKQVALSGSISFTSVLFLIFCGAFFVSILILISKVIIQKEKINVKNIFWGILLGILNFGNILFYLKAHKALAENPSTVFAGMNMGVILLGSCVGIFLFKEKLSKWNYIGIILAVSSIIFITLSQLYKN